jgi:hypothetical protein
MRWSDVSSLVGRYDLQGDNSAITSLVTLRNWLIVCRETGFYLGRYTGDPEAPFVFTPKYNGTNVPFWPDAIANVKGDYILYPARGERLYQFDGTTWPQLADAADDASDLFFDGYDQDDEVFCAENAITKEWFFFFPDKTVIFDYETPGGSVSVMDQAFNAAAMIHKPGTTDWWFVLAIANAIKTYGLAYGLTNIQTFLRDGVAVEGTLTYGLWSAQNQFQEKLLTSITPVFASQSPDASVEVELGLTHNPNAAVTEALVPAESLPTPAGRNFVTCAFQAIYMRPKLTIVETDDVDCRLSMLILEYELVGGAGVTRSVN